MALLIAAILVVVFVAAPAATLLALRWLPPPTTAFMVQKRIAAWWADERDPFRYRWVAWERISPHARLAAVAAEDQNFPRHHGFDMQAIEKAWEAHERGGKLRGASTITQQVAKNLFLTPHRTFARKGLEAWFTVLIEWLWPKRRILEIYLNIAEFGPGVFGIREASARYFEKPPDRLTEHEAAILAAVLPNPLRLHADRPSAYVLRRANWIEGQMRQLGRDYLARL